MIFHCQSSHRTISAESDLTIGIIGMQRSIRAPDIYLACQAPCSSVVNALHIVLLRKRSAIRCRTEYSDSGIRQSDSTCTNAVVRNGFYPDGNILFFPAGIHRVHPSVATGCQQYSHPDICQHLFHLYLLS